MTFTAVNDADVSGDYDVQAMLDKTDIAALVAANLRTGVISGSAVTQRAAGANNSVDLAAGVASLLGVPFSWSAVNLAVTAAHATLPRKDIVVVTKTGASAGTPSVVAGTPAADPVKPDIPTDAVLLFEILRPAASGSVVNADLKSKRVNVRAEPACFIPATAYSVIRGSPVLSFVAGQYPAWLLDPTTDEEIASPFRVPVGWVTMSVKLLWTNIGGGSGNVSWYLNNESVSDGESMNTSGTWASRVMTAPSQYLMKEELLSSSVAVTAEEIMSLRLYRRGTDATDTLASEAALVGVLLQKAS